MNLEIKDNNLEIWEKIQELIEKYEYYDQISISSFHTQFYKKIVNYNTEYNRIIVFGFLLWDFDDINFNEIIFNINKKNHQISMNALFLEMNKPIIDLAHMNGMTVGVYFLKKEKQKIEEYYNLFEKGIDVIITDYPILVANQLNIYYSDKIYLEGCKKSIKNNTTNISSCNKCKNGYELVKIQEEDRMLCKLGYEIDKDLYTKDIFNIYHEKKIFAIKMLYSPFDKHAICQKNNKTIFYFEWRFDLYGYDSSKVKKFILTNKSGYSKLTEKQIKKLNFSRLQIYADDNLINQEDFLCKDLYDMDYYTY